MIRIKCPKCAAPLALEDAKAGGVGECTECGAKFRVPAPKVKAPKRASRAVDDDDEDDYEDEDDEDEVDERGPGRRRARRSDIEDDEDEAIPQRKAPSNSGSLKGNLISAGIMLAVIIVTGIAGIFLKKIGIMVFFGSVLSALLCAIMVVRAATKEGGTLAFVCVVIALLMFVNGIGVTMAFFQVFVETGVKFPISLVFFFGPIFWSAFLGVHVVANWKDNARFAMVWAFCVVLAGVAFVATVLNKGMIDAHREQVRARHGLVMVVPRAALIQVDQRG
jgi:DNA-directed RNA polymerase subunit M/transcription elongation factor TFIIS